MSRQEHTTMLEKKLAKDFGDTFREYPILVPNNRTAGWPDRAIQLNQSRLVWFELKIIKERFGGTTITIDELTGQQAAWLAKWQMRGGFCYLFIGIVDYQDELSKYAILKCGKWDMWLKVPRSRVRIDQLLLFDDRWEILKWFRETHPR
jgi:hypothetical protein